MQAVLEDISNRGSDSIAYSGIGHTNALAFRNKDRALASESIRMHSVMGVFCLYERRSLCKAGTESCMLLLIK